MANKTVATTLAVLAGVLAAGFGGQGDGFQRERSGSTAALKDALEGKAPPAFTATEWLNLQGKAPTWESLKGKVVILDFWAHW
ncbi:MAG: hypothetical protein M9921_04220 [Fimbriimonadaceae bacterium]|nr:hypothetical protein [Chthonomonadaceae bacterium]MCO5296041.1 hypothetical protein [Fimbriimonadaceae bacterium]